ncbi:hypothetical protein LTR85_000727 [Meristemomyces frigidus]|nr:hypothetical protein LTR85_000727 [Meristemomyces frigidus]
MAPSRILLTGANGFLGAHILRQLLPRPGVFVRAVVRSQAKVEAVTQDFSGFSNIDFAIVPDITAPQAFDDALSKTDVPFDAVIHTASPFLYSAVTGNRDFLDPAVKGTTEMLKAVQAVAPSVKRVVITSSFAAVGDLAHMDKMAGSRYTEADWNPVTWEEALAGDMNTAYQGSKKFAEEAAWKFVEEEKPGFDIVTLCPPMIYGPLEHTVTKTSDLNQSTARIYYFFMAGKADAPLPEDSLYLYADPREVATAHISALYTPEASNQRFIICAGQVPSQSISDILRARFPELEERTPMGKPGVSSLSGEPYSASSEKAEKVLGIKFRPLEETVIDLGKQLLAIEKAEKSTVVA